MRGLPPGEASQLSKHQSDMVLVLFFVPCGERNRTIRNKAEQFGLCQNRPLEKPSGHEEHLLPLHCQQTTNGVDNVTNNSFNLS